MNTFLKQPKNIRIVRESVITGILVFLFLGLTSPFSLGNMHEQRLHYIFVTSALSMLVTFLVSVFAAYVLKMSMDPKQRNCSVKPVIADSKKLSTFAARSFAR